MDEFRAWLAEREQAEIRAADQAARAHAYGTAAEHNYAARLLAEVSYLLEIALEKVSASAPRSSEPSPLPNTPESERR